MNQSTGQCICVEDEKSEKASKLLCQAAASSSQTAGMCVMCDVFRSHSRDRQWESDYY